MPDPYNVPVQHPEWLTTAVEQGIEFLALVGSGSWPKSLLGHSIEVHCLHMLRAVHGSDQASLEALMRHVRNTEVRERPYRAMGPGTTEN